MAPRLLQAPSSSASDLVLGYLIRDEVALSLAQQISPDPAVVTEKSDVFNRIGDGGIASLDDVLSLAGIEQLGRLFLVGFSAGCQAVRVQLAAGVVPSVALAADGIHASDPPTEAQSAPWQEAARRAEAGELFFGVSYSQVSATKFLPTRTSIARILAVDTSQLGTIDDPAVQCRGRFCAYGVAGVDHGAHQTELLGRMLRDALESAPVGSEGASDDGGVPWGKLALAGAVAVATVAVGVTVLGSVDGRRSVQS